MRLVAAEKDDGRVVEELFLRILNRFPTPAETAAGVAALKSFDDDHGRLVAELASYEKQLPTKQAAWEKEFAPAVWTPLEIDSATSAVGATLAKEADHVIFASGKLDKDTYTVVASTSLSGITGIRLESLADPRLPHGGPGRAPNGNQVLNELHVAWAPKSPPGAAAKKLPEQQTVTLTGAEADYNQPTWHVSGAIDGDPATGWAVDGSEGKDHVAVFECKENIGREGGTVLTFRFDQQFPDGKHELGKFRLSATTSRRPIRLIGPPENIAKALVVAAEKRTPAQVKELADYFRAQDPEVIRLNQAIVQHANDQINARLMGAQDLAWALLNSPAFLFNR